MKLIAAIKQQRWWIVGGAILLAIIVGLAAIPGLCAAGDARFCTAILWKLMPTSAFTGLMKGGINALVALGLVLIYKSSQVFNFAQGQLVMIGAFITWSLMVQVGLPFGLALILGLAGIVLLSLLIERLALRPLTGQPILSTILMTLALGQILLGLNFLVWGGARQVFPEQLVSAFQQCPLPGLENCRVSLGSFYVPIVLRPILLWSFVVATGMVIAFALFFQFTKTGLAMRATAENHRLAQSVGLRVPRIFATAWGISGVIALAGGILLGIISGVDAVNLAFTGLLAFPAVLLGGP
ncbi:MAG: branched-chain amino acid ABC transporter permease [Anaerolineae bacterium]